MVLRILVVLTYQVWSGNEIRDVTFEIYCEEGVVKRGCQTLEIQYTAKSHHQQELFLSQGLLETNLTLKIL